MTPTAFFINTARGSIVDEKALYEVLSNDRIAGAGIDVFEQEPVSPDNPLLRLENIVVTPHHICLTDECITFARAKGYRAITLWTHDCLTAARHCYEKAGFTLTSRENRMSFGQNVVAEFWDREL